MPLPDFFLIGACRSGTTALFDALIQHPDVFMPGLKEPHYFLAPVERRTLERAGRESLRHRGFSGPVSSPQDYLALFSAGAGRRALGEASTGYIASAEAARRIGENLPGAKIVALLRHPVERAYAHYWFDVMYDFAPAATFEQSLRREPAGGDLRLPFGHFAHGLYHRHLSRYYEVFPAEQIRVYLYEDWRERPSELLGDLFSFLGVDPRFVPTVRTRNVTRAPRSRRLRRIALGGAPRALELLDERHNLVTPPPLRPQTRDALHARYREDIERLQELIGRDLSHWLAAPRVREAEHAAA